MKNLISRTITGILFIAIIIGAIWFSGRILLNVFLLCTCFAIYEYRSLLKEKGINLSLCFYGVAIAFYFIPYCQRYQFGKFNFLLAIALSLIAILFIVELFRKQDNPFMIVAYSVLGIVWIVLPFSLINIFPIYFGEQAKYLLLMIFIIIWASDTLAYCAGSLFGKHKLFERVSPKKTWEGTLISAGLTILLACFLPKLFALNISILQMIIFAAIIIVFGTLGDLTESQFKRTLEVKDSGNILPGHGGILDRFDSYLLAMPFVLFYLILIF